MSRLAAETDSWLYWWNLDSRITTVQTPGYFGLIFVQGASGDVWSILKYITYYYYYLFRYSLWLRLTVLNIIQADFEIQPMLVSQVEFNCNGDI